MTRTGQDAGFIMFLEAGGRAGGIGWISLFY